MSERTISFPNEAQWEICREAFFNVAGKLSNEKGNLSDENADILGILCIGMVAYFKEFFIEKDEHNVSSFKEFVLEMLDDIKISASKKEE